MILTNFFANFLAEESDVEDLSHVTVWDSQQYLQILLDMRVFAVNFYERIVLMELLSFLFFARRLWLHDGFADGNFPSYSMNLVTRRTIDVSVV